MLISSVVHAAPLGGQVTAGSAQISQSGATTTITQQSANASLSWQGFNVSSNETVNFVQPNSSAIAVNRILGNSGSQIFGHLNANGQVWLINPNGILFGPGSQINVGGLVASTLDIADSSITSNTRQFKGNGLGSIINQGSITAANGGYIALLGNQVSNQGYLSAQLGTIALGAGSATTLTFNGNQLLHLQVDESTLNNLAENKQLIQADGGQVIMSAGAKDSILASVVNNTGIIQAQTVENHDGTITLLGGMTAGTTNLDGKLDASAPNGGNGGFIETSAAHVKIADTAQVTTLAPTGTTGTWLIDPHDYTVAATGGDQSGQNITDNLLSTNVTLLSSSGATAGSGNININDAINWRVNSLTLTAANNINVNAVMTATGTASINLNPATTNGSDTAVSGGMINMGLDSNGFYGRIDYTSTGSLFINGTQYTVINSLGAAGSTTGTDLQGMNGNLSGHYVLGSNIDATSTSAWNGGAGFMAIGDSTNIFTGGFNGLGHTVNGLSINRPSTDYVGLFGYCVACSISNIGLSGGNVSGYSYVGGLVGDMESRLSGVSVVKGSIANSFVTSDVFGAGDVVGGLLGLNTGNIVGSYVTGSVTASGVTVGGLVGYSDGGNITNSYASGDIQGGGFVGGLAGYFNLGDISNSSYKGTSILSSGLQDNVGGLVGYASGDVNGGSTTQQIQISNSYATGAIQANNSGNVGGLVGYATNVDLSQTNAAVSILGGGAGVGGLIGLSTYTNITRSHAIGDV